MPSPAAVAKGQMMLKPRTNKCTLPDCSLLDLSIAHIVHCSHFILDFQKNDTDFIALQYALIYDIVIYIYIIYICSFNFIMHDTLQR